MPARVCGTLAALLELLQGVGARRFEKPIISYIAADICCNERLPRQIRDAFDYIGGRYPLVYSDANGRFQGKAAPEDAKPPKYDLLDCRQQVVAPIARRVWWRGNAVRQPLVKTASRSSSNSARPLVPKTATCAAASSRASGTPSSLRQISSTAGTSASDRTNPSIVAATRSANNSMAE
jgi:hypothetical protein